MAYVVGTANGATATATTATTIATTLPPHIADDLLLVCATDSSGANSHTVSVASGWTQIVEEKSQGVCQSWFYKKAASSSETAPTMNAGGSSVGWVWTTMVVRGQDLSTAIHGSADGNWASVNTSDNPALTTTEDGCLLLYSFSADQDSYMRLADNSAIELGKGIASGCVQVVAYRQQHAQGAVPTVTMYTTTTSEGGTKAVIAVKPVSSTARAPFCAAGVTPVRWYGNFGTQHDGTTTWVAPNSANGIFDDATDTTKIGGIALSRVGSGASPSVTIASPLNMRSWGLISQFNLQESTAGKWCGLTHGITSTDFDGKIFSVQHAVQVTSGARFGTEGMIVVFNDSGGNWAAFTLGTQASYVASQLYTTMIACGTGKATVYDSSGTLDWTDITKISYLMHRQGSSTSSNPYEIQNAVLLDAAVITGGSVDSPASFSVLPYALNQWGLTYHADLQGARQIQGKAKAQIGDGSTATYFDSSGSSFEYPAIWSKSPTSIAYQRYWNALADAVELRIKAASGDTINLAAGVFATTTSQPLVVDSTSSLSATYSFSGESLLGSTITDSAGLTWASATFKSGGTVTIAGGGDMTNCTIASTSSANAALAITANGSTLDGCTIDGTGAAYALELGTGVKEITIANTTITDGSTDKAHTLKTAATVTAGSFVTGDHYEIKTVGTTDFTLIGASANTIGVRFTATGAGSGTGDAYVAVKITISGTTSLAESDVTSAGAVVWVAAPSPTLDATVLSGSRVVLYNDTTAAELDNTAPAGTLWSKVITSGASSGDALTLHVFKEGYEEFSTSFIYAGIDNTLLVSQSVHASVASLRTELGITDYTTITEFALDITGTVEIDADDADGSTTKARLAIWYNGVLTTENGARYLRGAISVLSTAAIRINTSVLDLKIENISVTYGLNFTDTERRLYRDDGAAIYAPASAPGSIQNDYSGVPDTVTTSDQSLNLATAEQAIDNKLSSISSGVWTYVVTGSTTAVQMMRGFAAMLLGKVSGAGTGAETFRDIADTKDVATFMVDSSGNRTAVTRDLT